MSTIPNAIGNDHDQPTNQLLTSEEQTQNDSMRFSRRGMLGITAAGIFAALTSNTVANAAEPTEAERKKLEDADFLTHKLDVPYHIRILKAHPAYADFVNSAGTKETLQKIQAEESPQCFVAHVIVLFGKYLESKYTKAELAKDEIYPKYYIQSVMPYDYGKDIDTTYILNGYYIAQRADVITIGYAFNKPNNRIIDAEIVTINSKNREGVVGVAELSESAKFKRKSVEVHNGTTDVASR